ncbi:glutamate racemase [Desulfocicer vacuolatum DSM 3385]|uniref:Glutamate racemase n=1 Tax=Desulfocicer vacuolatum DSM 3385 TaxID=1121400 RepID=A0A1W2CFM4_9BACT|nr:aspartate/glutamate racemase family protein [Desulfocicer vacuolatum]SMC83959.1 glutamate racemase [Desulfocicer vacuolatum DSM 3385]
MSRTQEIKKRAHTILVTDSGLGGLSVFTEIANRLKAGSPWQRVNLVYFNAWPEVDRGYNHLPDMDTKARVFHNAMTAMAVHEPDRIFIACNTLSVIYPLTRFSTETHIEVTGIVDDGAAMIHQELVNTPDSRVIIFGTPTTTSARSHEIRLKKMGIKKNRIINQGCINLAGKIERNPYSDIVPEMIDDNVKQAAAKMETIQGRVFAALCCTHFGYCRDLFVAAVKKYITDDVVILNPNKAMAHRALAHGAPVTNHPDISMHIVSRIPWETSRIDAYSRMLKDISPETVDALGRYELNPELFDII